MQMACKEDPDKLYFSDNINDIIKFYYCFNDASELIKWSRSRPSAEINIVEKEGDSEVIFIVPTPDIKDKLTINLLESIKDSHTILVESKGKYFNYARSVNKGVTIALKYNPRWIIISNNDIIIRDDMKKLYLKLLNIDNKKVNSVIGAGGPHAFKLCKFTFLSNLLFLSKYKQKFTILKKFNIKFYFYEYKKFFDIICKPLLCVKNIAFFGEFLIISPYYILRNNGILFDETYINGVEDVDVFLNILSLSSYKPIHFNIEHLHGRTLENNDKRYLRNYINIIYLNYKIENNIIKINKNKIIL